MSYDIRNRETHEVVEGGFFTANGAQIMRDIYAEEWHVAHNLPFDASHADASPFYVVKVKVRS